MNPTQLVCIAAVFVGVIYDVFAWRRWGADATISNWLRSVSHEYPIIPFAIGVLAGHWFW